ncbi:ATP-binding protein [Candidatus Leptofilum sp.]|uniref:ATP-binding protein n=1 Tax=Candidatus Leptofilum sp. TaxID=3241576 RepID=UPI003B5BA3A9
MNGLENQQSDRNLHNEIGMLRQRIAELEANQTGQASTNYADFLFENSGETILIIDPYTMKILDVNPNAARRLGYRRSEIRQMSLDEIEMPRLLNAEDAETTWQSSVSGTYFYEGQYRHKDGTLIPVEVSSRLVYWEGQDVLINFARDIRWRKEAELALRQVNSTLEKQVRERTVELAAEKEKLEAVLGSIVEAIAMTDTEQRILYVNKAFVSITGFNQAEALTTRFDSFFDLSAQDRQAQADAFALGIAWSGEVKGWRKDGRTYPTILTIVPIQNDTGQITGYVTSHQDISRFQALDKAQYSFINNVTHQLRTPLTNIKLYTELLEGGLANGKSQHYLHVLASQAERLEHLVQDILELASLDSSNNVLAWRETDVAEMVFQMCEGNQVRAHQRQQTLRCYIEEGVPPVTGDPARLRQAVGELLDNALAYTPTGGHIQVEVAAPFEDKRQWLTVTVSDDGPGISEEEQKHIFERFFRGALAEQGQLSGTGLGLCISQQIAQAHHGHITLHSKSGSGASFTIWLPVDVPG